jgi:hypothetical protein
MVQFDDNTKMSNGVANGVANGINGHVNGHHKPELTFDTIEDTIQAFGTPSPLCSLCSLFPPQLSPLRHKPY